MTGPRIYSLAEIRATNFPTPSPLVEGLLSEGESVLLIGKPKIGKSRLTQQLTICLSRGEPFLQHRVPRAVRVLYLDLENRLSNVKSRFLRMAEPHDADKNIHIYAPETLDGDGNKEDVVMAGLKTLSQLRQDHPRLATVLIHHLRKQQDGFRVSLRTDPHSWVESASGHYSLIGHSDATYGLEREISDGEELIVFGGVARATVAPTLLLDEDEDTLLFEPSRSEAVAHKLFTPVERGIWEVANRLGKFTHSELLAAARTTNRKAISAMLNKARSGGMIAQDDGKLYRITAIGGTSGTMMYLQ
jgi:hypothetical protein